MKIAVVAMTLMLSVAVSAQVAPPPQTDETPQTPLWQFWLKGNAQLYENFFQASSSASSEDVTALQGEVGASLRVSDTMRAYGSLNTIHYDGEGLGTSPGVRVGLRADARPHALDIYVEQLSNRPSFDVGDQFDRADIRTLFADYSYRVMPQWQLGVDAQVQQQEFDITSSRDNVYTAVGGSVRWRPTRKFSPELGVRVGHREVDDDRFSYDQRDVYLQIRSSLTPKLYLSGRIRHRTREDDTRNQLTLGADYSLTQHLALNFYGAHEETDDFVTTMWLGGATWKW